MLSETQPVFNMIFFALVYQYTEITASFSVFVPFLLLQTNNNFSLEFYFITHFF